MSFAQKDADLANTLYKAMKGLGTDEDAMYKAAQSVEDQAQWGRVQGAFRQNHSDFDNGDLIKAIKGDLTGGEQQKFGELLRRNGVHDWDNSAVPQHTVPQHHSGGRPLVSGNIHGTHAGECVELMPKDVEIEVPRTTQRTVMEPHTVMEEETNREKVMITVHETVRKSRKVHKVRQVEKTVIVPESYSDFEEYEEVVQKHVPKMIDQTVEETIMVPKVVQRTIMVPKVIDETIMVPEVVQKTVKVPAMQVVKTIVPRTVMKERCVQEHFTEKRVLRFDPNTGTQVGHAAAQAQETTVTHHAPVVHHTPTHYVETPVVHHHTPVVHHTPVHHMETVVHHSPVRHSPHVHSTVVHSSPQRCGGAVKSAHPPPPSPHARRTPSPGRKYAVGTQVQVRWWPDGNAYDAKILRDNDDGTYCVQWDTDGRFSDVPDADILGAK